MRDGELGPLDETAFEPPQALLLTGEGLSRMTPERIATLRQIVGEFGLRVTVVADMEGVDLGQEDEPAPVPITRDDVIGFAREHEYSDARAFRGWLSMFWTADPSKADRFRNEYPPVRLLGDPRSDDLYHSVIDLRSVYERLQQSGLSDSYDAWISASRDTVKFMAHLVNVKLDLPEEEQLRMKRKPYLRPR